MPPTIDPLFARASVLKQALLDFVLDAEGELAIALEKYSADQLAKAAKAQYQSMGGSDMAVDAFLTEGRVGEQTPIALLIEQAPAEGIDLQAADIELLRGWERTFPGVFEVVQPTENGLELINWLTAQPYTVQFKHEREQEKLGRLKAGEILLTRISPVKGSDWMISNPFVLMGKLGKPKLAVAIGNFKAQYRHHLYSDAPELLEEAWRSVEQYHQDFVSFFETDELTLPGYQLEKKLTEFQDTLTQRKLQAAGLDGSKSLEAIAQEAGVSEEAIAETAEALGADAKTMEQLLKAPASNKMVAPKVELPAHLKKAESLTVLSHPRWGQMFLPLYPQLVDALTRLTDITEPDSPVTEPTTTLFQKALADSTYNTGVWRRLAERYPSALQTVLRTVTQNPQFDLNQDLESTLQAAGQILEPNLPETASVPLHLHNLFQDAVLAVSKERSKGKSERKGSAGFGAAKK